MPQNGVSLYFTIRDGGSQVLSAIGDKTRALDKETQSLAQAQKALQQANESLTKRQTELKTALEKSQVAVKDARTEYRRLKDEASGNALQAAIEEQEQLRQSLRDVEAQIKGNTRTFNEYRETLRKGSTSIGSATGSSSSGASAILSTLGQAGMFSFLGDAAAEWGTTLADSMFGNGAGSVLSSALSGAGSGAAIGSMIAPGIGTAVGAALGAAVGGLSGASQIYEAQDDAFKDYYGELFTTTNEQTQTSITSGSTTAGSREQTRVAFAQRFGSDAAAEEYLGRVQDMSAQTNYTYDEITGYSKLLLNSYDPDAVFGVLQSLSDATAALNLSSGDVEMMISGLSRMRTTGKTTQEYLGYFSERGVDVYSALSQALGVDKSQIAELVSDGGVSGETAAQAILDYIDQQYGGLSEELMGTYDAMVDNLQDIMTNIEAAAGEGYNEERKEGIQAEMAAYEGPLGEALQTINAISGQNQAYLENLSEQYQREALSAVLLGQGTTLFGEEQQQRLAEMGQEYAEAAEAYEAGNQEAGLRMEALKEEAEALATAAYESSEQYQTLQDVQMDQIGAIRENTAALNGWRNTYNQQQELSRGQAAAWVSGIDTGDGSSGGYMTAGEAMQLYEQIRTGKNHAVGLDYVPRDNYPALLHQGERILTANEARAQDRSEGEAPITVNISGEWNVRSASDVDAIADAIVEKLRLARMAG